MKINIYLLFFLLGCESKIRSSCVLERSKNHNIIYYESRDPGYNRAEAFNLDSEYIAIFDKEEIRNGGGGLNSEFRGPLSVCDSKDFWCQESGLILSLPKNISGHSSWSIQGMQCSILNTKYLNNDITYLIICKYNARWSTEFEYTRNIGVTKYRRVFENFPSQYLFLAGDCGLFSPKFRRSLR